MNTALDASQEFLIGLNCFGNENQSFILKKHSTSFNFICETPFLSSLINKFYYNHLLVGSAIMDLDNFNSGLLVIPYFNYNILVKFSVLKNEKSIDPFFLSQGHFFKKASTYIALEFSKTC